MMVLMMPRLSPNEKDQKLRLPNKFEWNFHDRFFIHIPLPNRLLRLSLAAFSSLSSGSSAPFAHSHQIAVKQQKKKKIGKMIVPIVII